MPHKKRSGPVLKCRDLALLCLAAACTFEGKVIGVEPQDLALPGSAGGGQGGSGPCGVVSMGGGGAAVGPGGSSNLSGNGGAAGAVATNQGGASGAATGGSSAETGGASATCDVTAVVKRRCLGAPCHSPGQPAAGLDLVSPGVDSRLVDVASRSTDCAGRLLIDPSSIDDSLLLRKVQARQDCGRSMPLDQDLRGSPDLDCLERWIAMLAAKLDP